MNSVMEIGRKIVFLESEKKGEGTNKSLIQITNLFLILFTLGNCLKSKKDLC